MPCYLPPCFHKRTARDKRGEYIMETKEYRIKEFEKVATPYVEYKPKIKIIKPDGETKWLDITEGELTEIRNILTK